MPPSTRSSPPASLPNSAIPVLPQPARCPAGRTCLPPAPRPRTPRRTWSLATMSMRPISTSRRARWVLLADRKFRCRDGRGACRRRRYLFGLLPGRRGDPRDRRRCAGGPPRPRQQTIQLRKRDAAASSGCPGSWRHGRRRQHASRLSALRHPPFAPVDRGKGRDRQLGARAAGDFAEREARGYRCARRLVFADLWVSCGSDTTTRDLVVIETMPGRHHASRSRMPPASR